MDAVIVGLLGILAGAVAGFVVRNPRSGVQCALR